MIFGTMAGKWFVDVLSLIVHVFEFTRVAGRRWPRRHKSLGLRAFGDRVTDNSGTPVWKLPLETAGRASALLK